MASGAITAAPLPLCVEHSLADYTPHCGAYWWRPIATPITLTGAIGGHLCSPMSFLWGHSLTAVYPPLRGLLVVAYCHPHHLYRCYLGPLVQPFIPHVGSQPFCCVPPIAGSIGGGLLPPPSPLQVLSGATCAALHPPCGVTALLLCTPHCGVYWWWPIATPITFTGAIWGHLCSPIFPS